MNNALVLIIAGFIIGTLGTLIGAGGGFILVPMLLLFHPDFSPEVVTAISMAVVACNAISGSIAYISSKRVDYKAGVIFAICTIPGSILGVLTTRVIPRHLFDLIFGVILIMLGVFLFLKGGKGKTHPKHLKKKGWITQHLTDTWGESYTYSYDIRKGALLSVLVGYLSPLLGIGGGIIHVPAMAEWLLFPVHIATATSHFVLAIMSTISVIVHIISGSYENPLVQRMVIFLAMGVVTGAQLGAYLSRRIKGTIIVKALAVCLCIVGLRILASGMNFKF